MLPGDYGIAQWIMIEKLRMNAGNGHTTAHRRMIARFDGHVQGVGFRYTTVDVAMDLDLRGFVRNEPDGSVTVVAEGPDEVLTDLLRRVKSSHLGRFIVNESVSWSRATGEFEDFSVRFGG